MILLVLFIVFMALWFISLLPNTHLPGSGFFGFLSVLLLFFMVHGLHVLK